MSRNVTRNGDLSERGEARQFPAMARTTRTTRISLGVRASAAVFEREFSAAAREL